MDIKDVEELVEGKRVVVTIPFHGLTAMQVCAVDDATDQEILDVCNKENKAGTTNGWVRVYRSEGKPISPGPCAEIPGRTHFIVCC
jgi:hypothetical protein